MVGLYTLLGAPRPIAVIAVLTYRLLSFWIPTLVGVALVQAGDVLVSENTDPDWEPVMRRVAAIVTNQGGRTAHAAIVSREFGIPCIVGTGSATSVLEKPAADGRHNADHDGELWPGEGRRISTIHGITRKGK